MSDMQKLIEAVEQGWGDLPREMRSRAMKNYWHGLRVKHAHNGSLDAAKALHDALLSDWGWHVSRAFPNWEAAVWNGGKEAELVGSTTPARAWLLAILKAYEATR